MKTILLSTSTGWNAGDDWIREGVLNALQIRDEVNLIFWNRGYGIEDSYANSLNVNLPHVDYVIMAGSPEWIAQNETLYRHCLFHEKKMALLGVGMKGGYIPSRHEDLMRRVGESGLVEVAIGRDEIASTLLADFGIPSLTLSDPAIFLEPRAEVGEGTDFVIGYRGWGAIPSGTVDFKRRDGGPSKRTDVLLSDIWSSAEGPKRVTVHDNREISAAVDLFGKRSIIYESDPWRLLMHYGRTRAYVGSRIHGFVASLVHGATAHLIYHTQKAGCAEVIIERLGLEASAFVSYIQNDSKGLLIPILSPPGASRLRSAIERELALFRGACLKGPELRSFMKGGSEV